MIAFQFKNIRKKDCIARQISDKLELTRASIKRFNILVFGVAAYFNYNCLRRETKHMWLNKMDYTSQERYGFSGVDKISW